MVCGRDRPELALRHVVYAKERKLVCLQEYARGSVPGAAGLRVYLDAVRMCKTANRTVEIVAEHFVANAAEVLHHLRVLAETREGREVRTQRISGTAAKLLLETRSPCGYSPFPTDGIDMRKRRAHKRPHLPEEVARHAVEVSCHRVGVDHVDVEFAIGDGTVAEAQRHLASARCVGGEGMKIKGTEKKNPFDFSYKLIKVL